MGRQPSAVGMQMADGRRLMALMKTAVVPNPPGSTAASHSETPRLHYGRRPGKWGMLQGQAAHIV